MVEIKTGEYVRTKKGIIYQADQDYYLNNDIPIKFATFSDRVVDHNKNILKIIKPGDYVNGLYVWEQLEDGRVHTINGSLLDKEDIQTIVTREQFKNIEYKVGERR